MKKYFLLFILFCSIFTTGYSQVLRDSITWKNNRPLSFDDFRNKTTSKEALAIIYCRFNYHMDSIVKRAFLIRTEAIFYRDSSWIKYKDANLLLQHAQGYFDLCELYARKFRKALISNKIKSSTVFEQMDSLLYLYRDSLDYRNKEYDNETAKGYEYQDTWNKKIKDELEIYRNFGDIYIKIYYINK